MENLKLHGYQSYCVDRICRDPFVGLFLDMGLGKTAITLAAVKRLKYEMFCIRRCLVIAPKKVAESTWTKEAAKWIELNCLVFSSVLGTSDQRKAALEKTADIYLINRENVKWLVNQCGNRWPFDMVVLDESSSFKNHRAQRFRALRAVRPKISRLVELTGTPSPRGLSDLWAQIYLLDGGARLGRTISSYRDAWFLPDKRNQTTIFSYVPRAGAAEEIYRRISDICISMRSEDYLELPDAVVDDIPVALDGPARKAYMAMERHMLLEVDDGEPITAASAAALTGKLLQLCNGAAYNEDGEVVHIHDCKLEAFMETIEQLNGQHALVYYHFRHDLERLLDILSGSGLRVAVFRGPETEEAWNSGKVDILLAQPASCGYGLNLQQGGHHVIWFGLTWNLEEYQQANKRLHRQGQPYPVIIHRLIVQGSTDEDVVKSLEQKDGAQEALLSALKARIGKAREGKS